LEFYEPETQVEPVSVAIVAPRTNPTPALPANRQVFLVHGHDEVMKQTVARYLEKLDLDPIILHEKPDKGRTIIQKFEDHADVAFAIVLLTPDDLGRLRGADQGELRARQNVILELGYFIGRLGRDRVCALKGGGVIEPSDLHGVLYVPFDDYGAWKLLLARELRAAQIDIDLNLVLSL
jgi:predicted nucleotide-binding protein